MSATIRCFLALLPDAGLAGAIDAWAIRNYGALGRRSALQNLHVTLVFLGELAPSRIDEIQRRIDVSSQSAFELRLNDTGFAADAGTLWLCPKDDADGVQHTRALVRQCRSICQRVGVRLDKRAFLPHMTLARQVSPPVPGPLVPPDFVLPVNGLALQQSFLRSEGVRHDTLAWWEFGDRRT